MIYAYFSRYGDYDSFLTESNYIINPGLWFNSQFYEDFLRDEISQNIVRDIEGAEIIQDVIRHPVYGSYSPEDLATTTKTLLLIHNRPEFFYNGAMLGENAAKWIQHLAVDKDVHLRIGYLIPFSQPINMRVVNDGSLVSSEKEYREKQLAFTLGSRGLDAL